MNSDETNGHQLEWESCVVCGNSVMPERGAVRFNHHGNTINVCGPQCLRSFAEEPAPYIARLARAAREREFRTEVEQLCP